MTEKLKNSLAKVASLMGKKGGKSGQGKSKIRGNSSYYRDMQRKSVLSRLASQDDSTVKKKNLRGVKEMFLGSCSCVFNACKNWLLRSGI